MRVGIAYNSCADEFFGVNSLENDFDLWVKEDVPPWFFGFTFSSVTLNNEVEMIQAPSVGWNRTFLIQVRVKGASALTYCHSEMTEPVAIVWDMYPDPQVIGQ